MTLTPQQALKQYFGHDSFRPNQEELIQHLLLGQDVLGVMPTGAGKSLVYQIPAIVSSGFAVVISPLISLMKDQVDALNQAGVHAAYLNSSQSAEEQAAVLHYVESGGCKLLYVAPERLDAPRFVTLCKAARVSLVAIDEAHCVSQWGQDFRPSYLRIAGFIAGLPKRPPVCALTATATPVVREDIARALELQNPHVLVGSFDRPNLYFGVERPTYKDKKACLLRLIRERKNNVGIVYCSTRAAVDDVWQFLDAAGFGATRYHAGLSAEERRANQDDFLFDRKTVMVATNAFGMGIDKSNVSYVIHYNLPTDPESYYQEAGRAGRDGSPADCILIYNAKDAQTCEFLLNRAKDERLVQLGPDAEKDVVRALEAVAEHDAERLRQMVFYATTTDCLRGFLLRYFGETGIPHRCENCSTCLTDYEVEDVSMDALKILSCVARLAQRGKRVGKTTIVDILRGSKAEKIVAADYDSLSTYNIMAQVPAKRVRYVLDELVSVGYLSASSGDYPVVTMTEAGTAFLRERGRFEVKVPKRLPKAAVVTASEGAARGYGAAVSGGVAADPLLFERLKALRLRIAAEERVPAYVVFTNAALTDMCVKLPTTPEQFLEVSGVGQAKAQRYGEEFLSCLQEYAREKGL